VEFLTSHARVLLCIAHDPGVRLRDIAASLGITERSGYGIITDLTVAGYVVKEKDGRRNRYQIQPHLPLPGPASQRPATGEVLALLAGVGKRARNRPRPDQSEAARPRRSRGTGAPPLAVSQRCANRPGDRLWGSRTRPPVLTWDSTRPARIR
jgi:hypothetical protein